MRRSIASALALLTACSIGGSSPSSSATTSPAVSRTPVLPSPVPSVTPVGVPPRTPASFDQDLDGADLPPAELVPRGSTATGAWLAETAVGHSVVVTYAIPAADPLRVEQGLVVWRQFPSDPPWRPVFGRRNRPARGVLQIEARIGDATGDGSDDVLIFEETGGSGVCGTWRVIDLAANIQVFKKKTCDTRIDLSATPAGLVLDESVYEEGDAHCCPSATKTTILVYQGIPDAWRIASQSVSPT
jgi:hypothetical protein